MLILALEGSPSSEIRKPSPSKVAFYQDSPKESEATITSACTNPAVFYQDDSALAASKGLAHAVEVSGSNNDGNGSSLKDLEVVDEEVRKEALAEVANLRLSFVSFLEKLPDKSYLAAFKEALFEEAPQPGREPLTYVRFSLFT